MSGMKQFNIDLVKNVISVNVANLHKQSRSPYYYGENNLSKKVLKGFLRNNGPA